ncbi:MAG: hypothetical protein M9949_06265 [Candidatus Kapabacteria bacterium]|nr:hypothetical protein [Candidatus Kapabacteria bacterium]
MASTTYNDWQKWKIIPIQTLQISFANGNDYTFGTLEAGSAFSIDFITEENDSGGEDIQLVELTASAIVVQNNYGDMYTFLNDCNKQKVTNFNLKLKNNPGQLNPGEIWIHPLGFELDPPLTFTNYQLKWNIKQSGISPKLTLNLRALLSIDAFDTVAGGILVIQTGAS